MERRKAPASIHVASLGLLLTASVQGGLALQASATSSVGFGQWIFAAAVMGVLVWGIARGYRLAWLWGRYLALVLALTMLGLAGLGVARGGLRWGHAAVMVGGMGLPLLATWLALGRATAVDWFDLRCPECGARSSRGKDFLFREARCPRCGHEW